MQDVKNYSEKYSFDGHELIFESLKITTGEALFTRISSLGKALGYAKDGYQLLDLLTEGWKPLFHQQDELNFSEYGSFISVRGMELLTTISRAKKIPAFKIWLRSTFPGMVATTVVKRSHTSGKKVVRRDASTMDDAAINKRFALAYIERNTERLLQNGLINEEQYKNLMVQSIGAALNVAGVDTLKIETKEKVDNSFKIPKPSKELLAAPYGEPPHDLDLGYLTAAEIGKPYGLSPGKITKYINRLNLTRPNEDASSYVEMNGADGVPQIHKEPRYHLFRSPDGIAVYVTSENQVKAWRNYWSPNSVQRIIEEIKKDVEAAAKQQPTA